MSCWKGADLADVVSIPTINTCSSRVPSKSAIALAADALAPGAIDDVAGNDEGDRVGTLGGLGGRLRPGRRAGAVDRMVASVPGSAGGETEGTETAHAATIATNPLSEACRHMPLCGRSTTPGGTSQREIRPPCPNARTMRTTEDTWRGQSLTTPLQ